MSTRTSCRISPYLPNHRLTSHVATVALYHYWRQGVLLDIYSLYFLVEDGVYILVGIGRWMWILSFAMVARMQCSSNTNSRASWHKTLAKKIRKSRVAKLGRKAIRRNVKSTDIHYYIGPDEISDSRLEVGIEIFQATNSHIPHPTSSWHDSV